MFPEAYFDYSLTDRFTNQFTCLLYIRVLLNILYILDTDLEAKNYNTNKKQVKFFKELPWQQM